MPSQSFYPAAGEPAVRGRYMQTFASYVDRLPAEDRDAIREAVPKEVWESVERVSPLGWLPADANLRCTSAVVQRLGARRAHEFFSGLMMSSFDTTLLKGFIAAILRIAGRDLAQYLNWVSRGYNLMFKDCGEWAVAELDEGVASLEVNGLPQAFARDRVWLESCASSLGALFLLARVEGTVAVRDTDVNRGRAIFKIRWKPPD